MDILRLATPAKDIIDRYIQDICFAFQVSGIVFHGIWERVLLFVLRQQYDSVQTVHTPPSSSRMVIYTL
ncbi:hypothetical protein PHYBLDRAFT_139447 [Phycomyces blakesleeanus NRRL 1555(-)]|uniref:Uncharacterized protein n=1 Tax=Phycomyces blakesleeanus (strain ATCC 8743b / DSM 1359 / FGSC 10004 / NBRC 33097 / NRRL 1555) TaxID=763407 RepID=A0A167QBF3_PHYB8|nr:hypothetical protein PHYBLDRAFT_139447 [Phycomyces blakesleeanus NRRL 1555(-)]OAD79418.1 hypothetical protein PHYBLDRAFT_139447 [Phycomyces blakesleeanus NRRL 1555(-)]|eukprot:XP_018297458.1 hypothetical protein PHYBLDRAFT_139447 [Phycomyces blakesleeanus NRRL 1555(-)]